MYNLILLFYQNVIKKVVKVLIKRSIYPTQEEFYDATNEFLNENHEDFIMKYSKRKWSTIYEKYFYKPVSWFNFCAYCAIFQFRILKILAYLCAIFFVDILVFFLFLYRSACRRAMYNVESQINNIILLIIFTSIIFHFSSLFKIKIFYTSMI